MSIGCDRSRTPVAAKSWHPRSDKVPTELRRGDPVAAFLLGGIYIARPVELLNAYFDLERFEVLRGPLGTLYGRNTTAFVIACPSWHVIHCQSSSSKRASINPFWMYLSWISRQPNISQT